MKSEKKSKTIKLIIFITVILILIGFTIYLFPIVKSLFSPEGREAFKVQIQESGVKGGLMLLGLELAQILMPVIPGEPIEILAGMCYGTLGGLIFITISVLVITTFIFFMVRKFGRDFLYTMISKEKIEKIENSKLFRNPKRIEYIMLILFFIPGTPKDLLTYIAGILPINPLRFILISTLARFPSTISSTLAGSTLVEGNWYVGIAMYIIIFVIVGIIMLLAKKFDKSNTTKEILEESKKVK